METEPQFIETIDVASGPSPAHNTEAVADLVTEENETSAPAEADIHDLKFGYIFHTPKNAQRQAAHSEGAKGNRGPPFAIVGRQVCSPILLFGNQMIKLIKELPNAYQAFRDANSSYRYVLYENKSNLVALEVSYYNGKNYLFLKKYFQASAEAAANETFLASSAQEINGNPWLPTKAVVGLDPAEDKPRQMLAFVLSCCQ